MTRVTARVVPIRGRDQDPLDPGRVDPAGDEVGVAEDPPVERDRRLHALDDQLVEGPAHRGQGLDAGWGRGRSACRGASRSRGGRCSRPGCASPSGRPGRPGLAEPGDPAGRGAEVVVGVLGVDPALDRVAADRDVLLGEREGLAGGDPDLLLDQVDPRDHLGDGVLDLDPGVDLDEVEIVVGVDEELAGAGVDVAGLSGQPDGGLAQPRADLQREGRGGRLLDELLMAALERAIAVPAVDECAVLVGEDLDLDVARPIDELLEVDAGVLERGLGLVAGGLEGGGEVGLVAADCASPCRRRRRRP